MQILLRTSNEWQKMKPEIKVVQREGWDQSNLSFSWFDELITEDEFERRAGNSSVISGNIVNRPR